MLLQQRKRKSPLVSLPALGNRVVYFPQGHSEQVRRLCLFPNGDSDNRGCSLSVFLELTDPLFDDSSADHVKAKYKITLNDQINKKHHIKEGVVLLGSELIKSSSEERSLLKNLGSWLGKITIGRNQVLRAREIDPKTLIIEHLDSSPEYSHLCTPPPTIPLDRDTSSESDPSEDPTSFIYVLSSVPMREPPPPSAWPAWRTPAVLHSAPPGLSHPPSVPGSPPAPSPDASTASATSPLPGSPAPIPHHIY
ncbi:hypothetical protein POM88_034422 [Heracleum sosnowskyi]|uniref:CCR4-NOT transcription complex subunit 1 CAF1-binding domain-containing protein n=1 Tax=Heracleum sosnowskyi TaxID=360622 RepID=A0AAD8HJ89_9APIA|nr:hypothetical protein POM88_034422 [Heracleum sosnowskyi]